MQCTEADRAAGIGPLGGPTPVSDISVIAADPRGSPVTPHPYRGVVIAERFAHLAEEVGLSPDLGALVADVVEVGLAAERPEQAGDLGDLMHTLARVRRSASTLGRGPHRCVHRVGPVVVGQRSVGGRLAHRLHRHVPPARRRSGEDGSGAPPLPVRVGGAALGSAEPGQGLGAPGGAHRRRARAVPGARGLPRRDDHPAHGCRRRGVPAGLGRPCRARRWRWQLRRGLGQDHAAPFAHPRRVLRRAGLVRPRERRHDPHRHRARDRRLAPRRRAQPGRPHLRAAHGRRPGGPGRSKSGRPTEAGKLRLFLGVSSTSASSRCTTRTATAGTARAVPPGRPTVPQRPHPAGGPPTAAHARRTGSRRAPRRDPGRGAAARQHPEAPAVQQRHLEGGPGRCPSTLAAPRTSPRPSGGR